MAKTLEEIVVSELGAMHFHMLKFQARIELLEEENAKLKIEKASNEAAKPAVRDPDKPILKGVQ
jgi:hypothetical protein